jgi:HSP20 family protein
MLMRTDPFRELDRFTQQALGTAARPAVMPMDAWREGDAFFVEFDLPGINQDSLDLDIERNVVTESRNARNRAAARNLQPAAGSR